MIMGRWFGFRMTISRLKGGEGSRRVGAKINAITFRDTLRGIGRWILSFTTQTCEADGGARISFNSRGTKLICPA